ncbi:uncharacterized mitochondrial protein-like protein, partial [Tanacetum coccineum]
HIPYYSVPANSHNLTQSELIKIDPFEEPRPIMPPITPKAASETTTTTETPLVSDTPPKTTTTTETPPFITYKATPTVTQPNTQSSSEVASVPPTNVQPTRKYDFVYFCYSSSFSLFIASIHHLHKPMSYREAVCDPLWQVYKMKTKSDGPIERYKARLVIEGYAQEYSMDNEETFVPVVKIIKLAYRSAMKDLGLFCYFLGIEVASSPKGYLLSQSKYIGDLLDRARITYKMVEDILINAKAKYTLTDGDPLLDPSLYQTIVVVLHILKHLRGYTSQSTPMLKTTSNSSKKDNLSMSNSFSALNEEEEDDEEDVENMYDESANLIQNTKAGGSSSFTAAAG